MDEKWVIFKREKLQNKNFISTHQRWVIKICGAVL